MAEQDPLESWRSFLAGLARATAELSPEDEKTNRDRFESEQRQEQIHYLREIVNQLKDTNELRRKYARSAYGLLVTWMLFILALVIVQGFKIGGFNLSDVVLAAIVGSTAVSVVGLMLAVIKGLFVPPPILPPPPQIPDDPGI